MSVHRILALTDLSENSLAGLDLAERLSHRLHARIVVGYVHTRTDILESFSRGREDALRLAQWVREDDEEHLRAVCEKHIEPLRLQGVETVEMPNARTGVQELIERSKPDLVCMATRGRSGVAHLLLGSIAEHTLRTAGVPVIVTKGVAIPPPGEPLRVLVALDLIEDPSGFARNVATLLGEGDEIVLGHVVESWYYSPAAYGSEFALPQPDVPELAEAARSRLAEIDVRVEGVSTSVEVGMGRPGEGLLELEERVKPNIVAARTHGRRGLDRMMLGSVSEFLARRCEGAVLIFPSGR